LSERSKQNFSKYIREEKSYIIPNFIPPSTVDSVTQRENFWLFVGRLSEEKGVLELIKTWPRNHNLCIVGTGPLEKDLKSAASQNIQFLGAKSRVEIDLLLSQSKGLVIPSLWSEGLPTVYLEALANSTPVLTITGNSAGDDVLESGAGIVLSDWTWLVGIENILGTLNEELVGLKEVKTKVREISSVLLFDRIREIQGLVQLNSSLHMAFTGRPGTGKTSVATKIALVLRNLGYLTKGHITNVTREDLVGQYVPLAHLKY
jgi:glycosyltransferase involved in cell wall biosynthesis